MQQVAAMLTASPADSLDQLTRVYDRTLSDCNELIHDHRSDLDLVTSKSQSVNQPFSHYRPAASSAANSSFSIENILSSPKRRNHGIDYQQQQLDKYHRHPCKQTTDESSRTDYNGTSQAVSVLPTLPFYGQCPMSMNRPYR